MTMRRFDLDDAAKEAHDAAEADTLRPASLLTDLLFWLITIIGTALLVYFVVFIGVGLAIHLHGGH